jgi:hypothetical protein
MAKKPGLYANMNKRKEAGTSPPQERKHDQPQDLLADEAQGRRV